MDDGLYFWKISCKALWLLQRSHMRHMFGSLFFIQWSSSTWLITYIDWKHPLVETSSLVWCLDGPVDMFEQKLKWCDLSIEVEISESPSYSIQNTHMGKVHLFNNTGPPSALLLLQQFNGQMVRTWNQAETILIHILNRRKLATFCQFDARGLVWPAINYFSCQDFWCLPSVCMYFYWQMWQNMWLKVLST